MLALGQLGIGAIYPGNVFTRFSLKKHQNETLAVITRSGIFIRENEFYFSSTDRAVSSL